MNRPDDPDTSLSAGFTGYVPGAECMRPTSQDVLAAPLCARGDTLAT